MSAVDHAANSKAIAIREKRSPAVLEWDDEYRRLVKLTVLRPKNREATGAELAMFAEQVQRTGLDPFFKQIYGIYRWDSRAKAEVMQVQAGIDGFRLTAERTGKYEGQTPAMWCAEDGIWTDVWTKPGNPFAARVGVYKKGRREPTYAVAHWREYVQKNQQGNPAGKWADMPANQLAKCAEALALRKCFPAELSGLYTPEEMEQAENHPSLSEGVGDGQPVGLDLGPEVEKVMARATALGHTQYADRATTEMVLDGQPPEKVKAWVKAANRELDEIPVDAVVVDGEPAEARKSPVSRSVAQTPDTKGEAANAQQARRTAGEAGESQPDPERIEALRRRGLELLDTAEALSAADDPRADEVFEEAERCMAEVDAASDPSQERMAF